MGDHAEKIRLATGVFYDLDRLARALGDFLALGLTAEDMRLAAPRAMMTPGSALHQALAARGGGLAALAEPENAPVAIDGLLAGDIGAILAAHLENGAIVATAMSLTPAMQDQCMRILLRHSLHTVHARDWVRHRAAPPDR